MYADELVFIRRVVVELPVVDQQAVLGHETLDHLQGEGIQGQARSITYQSEVKNFTITQSCPWIYLYVGALQPCIASTALQFVTKKIFD